MGQVQQGLVAAEKVDGEAAKKAIVLIGVGCGGRGLKGTWVSGGDRMRHRALQVGLFTAENRMK